MVDGREFTVTFEGSKEVLVQSVSATTGAYRMIWKDGRPMSDLIWRVVSNAMVPAATF